MTIELNQGYTDCGLDDAMHGAIVGSKEPIDFVGSLAPEILEARRRQLGVPDRMLN